jgi:hypothetical protein
VKLVKVVHITTVLKHSFVMRRMITGKTYGTNVKDWKCIAISV